jgi:ABC-type transport system involved in multi-copper enzyme maturation permease subunit
MDLVNQDMQIREELKEAYQQHRAIGNEKSANTHLQHQYSTEGKQYLVSEPSNKEADLPNPDNTILSSHQNESKWPIGFLPQMLILSSRSFRLTGKRQFTFLNFGQAIALALISGLCWLRMEFTENTIPDRSSFIFFIMTFWPFQTLMMGLLSFPFERAVIEKERASGSYRLSAYFIGKSLAEAPLILVLPTLFLIIAYWMARINNDFGIFLGILVFQLLSIIVAESFGLFLGAALKNLHHAITAATIALIGLMLIGGFFIQHLPNWLGVWARWVSFFKYAYSACLRLQFMGPQVYRCVDGSYVDVCRNNTNGTFLGSDALRYFDAGIDVGYNFLVLFGMFVVFRSMAYFALRFLKIDSGRT